MARRPLPSILQAVTFINLEKRNFCMVDGRNCPTPSHHHLPPPAAPIPRNQSMSLFALFVMTLHFLHDATLVGNERVEFDASAIFPSSSVPDFVVVGAEESGAEGLFALLLASERVKASSGPYVDLHWR